MAICRYGHYVTKAGKILENLAGNAGEYSKYVKAAGGVVGAIGQSMN